MLAHRDGLAAISLRELADRVGLRQPSLYTYFDSKLAIYDAMFAAGNEVLLDRLVRLPPEPDVQQQLVAVARTFVQFSTDDPVRYQLLFQRTIPGFEPSPQSYALAQRVYEHSREQLAAAGGTLPADMDMWTALIAGLADQQVANDPGGERWVLLIERTVAMFLTDLDRRRRPNRGRKRPQ